MPHAFDPRPAAELLAEAWRTGRQLRELRAAIRPGTVADGYDVQDALIALLAEPVVGWKLGVGSAKLKAQTGIGRSIAGRVLKRHRYGAGASVPLPNAAPVTVEFEIAYVLGDTVSPHSPERPVWDWIAQTRVTFELVLSRFVDRRAVGWPSFAADNVGFQALVIGPVIDPKDLPEVAASLAVSVNGSERARAATGEDATDSLTAFGDLIAIARERRMTLPAGSIVSTGSVSLPFAMDEPDAEVRATFLERELRFRTQTPRG